VADCAPLADRLERDGVPYFFVPYLTEVFGLHVHVPGTSTIVEALCPTAGAVKVHELDQWRWCEDPAGNASDLLHGVKVRQSMRGGAPRVGAVGKRGLGDKAVALARSQQRRSTSRAAQQESSNQSPSTAQAVQEWQDLVKRIVALEPLIDGTHLFDAYKSLADLMQTRWRRDRRATPPDQPALGSAALARAPPQSAPAVASNYSCRSTVSRRPLPHVLCEARGVRVLVRCEMRFLQFRGTGPQPYQKHEANVECEERAQQEHETNTQMCPGMAEGGNAFDDAAQCLSCPCTPIQTPSWGAFGFSFLLAMFDTVTAHDARCGASRPTRSPVNRRRFRMLQIGLGGGSFAVAVRRRCNAHVDVIEYQSTVVVMAQRFLGFPASNSNATDGGERLIIADGLDGVRQLLAEHTTPYDAVAIDCMIQGATPPTCKSVEFVAGVSSLLRPNGAITQWAFSGDDKLLQQRYLEHFADVSIAPHGEQGVLKVRGKRSTGAGSNHDLLP